jgi:hypothetical protein
LDACRKLQRIGVPPPEEVGLRLRGVSKGTRGGTQHAARQLPPASAFELCRLFPRVTCRSILRHLPIRHPI